MPIVYVHGVSTRQESPSYRPHLQQIEKMLGRYVAPEISPSCKTFCAYWGEYAAKFAWGRASRPKTVLLGQGAGIQSFSEAAQANLIASLDAPVTSCPITCTAPVEAGGLVPSGPQKVDASSSSTSRLKGLDSIALSDFLSAAIVHSDIDPNLRADMLIAADEIAHENSTHVRLGQCSNLTEELEELRGLLARKKVEELVGQGAGSVWNKIVDRMGESISRVTSAPAFALSTAVAEWREPINNLVTLFIGDVFTYLANRGTAENPGDIPRVVLETLRMAKAQSPEEPLIILSHSMGGQIIYDLVSYFLPASKSDLRIDYWCATASQVGLFEEMKLFRASTGLFSSVHENKVPPIDPKYLGGWWNVWDHNDFLSYTALPIFDGVDDEFINSGVSLIRAHGEYLLRPSFYRKFKEKLSTAKQADWGRR
jgi:hypothetical protein